MKTSCPSDVFTIPRIAFLVVCGIGETIETGSPLAVFKKVDFPADGRPIIATTAVFVSEDSGFSDEMFVSMSRVYNKRKILSVFLPCNFCSKKKPPFQAAF